MAGYRQETLEQTQRRLALGMHTTSPLAEKGTWASDAAARQKRSGSFMSTAIGVIALIGVALGALALFAGRG